MVNAKDNVLLIIPTLLSGTLWPLTEQIGCDNKCSLSRQDDNTLITLTRCVHHSDMEIHTARVAHTR